MEENVKMKKVEWKGDEKYELYLYNENEIEAFHYVYPLLSRGYGNYFAFSVYYNLKDGVLTLTYFSDGWNGSGIHWKKHKEIKGLDVEYIAKMSPKRAFEYLYSYFDEDE